MERKSGKAIKITMGLVGAGLLAASALPADGGRRSLDSVDGATRAIWLGAPNATERAATLAATSGDAAAAIGRVAEAENVDALARDRALEALARAGTVASQAALRHALSAPSVRGEADYPMLVARLAAVETPIFDTLIYLAELRATATEAGELALAEAASPVCHRLHHARAPLGHKR
jgi:hypothetical protein